MERMISQSIERELPSVSLKAVCGVLALAGLGAAFVACVILMVCAPATV
jgi:hypothetical protein